jgi:hypothetical protein
MRTDAPTPPLSEIMTQALCYWEKMRLAFTTVLTVVFFLSRKWGLLTGQPKIFLYLLVIWILLGTLANALYCVCYVPEIAFQISALRDVWKQCRWILFTLLTIVGSILMWLIPMIYGI